MTENTHCSVNQIDPSAHLGLVRMVANRYAKKATRAGVSPEDVFQTGVIGLLKAVSKYDPVKWTFSTYAVSWIRHEISRFFDNFGSTVRVPAHLLHGASKLENAIDLASMDDEITEYGGTLHDLIGDDQPSAEQLVYGKEVLARLDEKERYVLERRFLDESANVIGAAVGISGQTVRRIERDVLNKLKKRVEAA